MKTLAIELLETFADPSMTTDGPGNYVPVPLSYLELILRDVQRIQDYAWTLAQAAHSSISMSKEEYDEALKPDWEILQQAIDRQLNVDLAIIYGGIHAAPASPILGESDGDSPTVPTVSDGDETGQGSMGADEQP